MSSLVRPLLFSCVSLPALALASPALSQQTGAIALDPIVLTADDADDADDAPAGGYVAVDAPAATKTATPLLEVQQAVSVVTTAQIEDQGARNLGQALGYSAGVLAEPFGVDPRFDSPTIRGFEGRDAQYLNGLRVLRSFGAPSVEVYGLEAVEVLRGPSSALFGAGTPAGIINQVQKHAQDGSFAEAGLGYGSYGDLRAFVDVNRQAGADLSYRLTGLASDASTQIDQLTDTRGYLAGALRWQADPATRVDLLLSHQADSPISPPGVPFGLTQTADGEALRDFYAGEPSADGSDREMTNLGAEIRHDFANGWRLEQNFRYQKFDWDYTGFYVSGLDADGMTIARGVTYQDEDTATINLDSRIGGDVTTGAVSHRLLFGVDLRHYDDDTATEFGTAPAISYPDPEYGVDVPKAVFYSSGSDLTLRQIGVYAQDELALGNWRGTLALRHDRAEQSGTRFTNFAGTSRADQDDDALTGRAGLSYLFAGGLAPYASYATSFDPEIGTDIDGNTLQPTEGEQYGIGVKFQPVGIDAFVTAAVYDLTQQNVSRSVTEDGITGTRQFGEVRSRGAEIEATAALARGWDLRAAYAYNDTEQQGGPEDGRALPNAPRHTASLWMMRDLGNGLRAGGGIRHLGARFGDAGNSFRMGAVNLVDLAATWTRGHVETQLNLSNLTDEVYLANCGSFGCYYGEGRTANLQVAYSW